MIQQVNKIKIDINNMFLAIILYKALFTTLNQNYIQEYQYTQQRMALLRFYRLLHSGNEHFFEVSGGWGGGGLLTNMQ